VSVRFGGFTLDRQTRQLLRGTVAVHLAPKEFELLALLIEQRPTALSKSVIHGRLWPETFVSDGNLALLVANIRDAIGDDARHPTFVRTVHRFGYAFVAKAIDSESPSVPATTTAAWWLIVGKQQTPLLPGEHVLGRDAGADIRIGRDAAANIRADTLGVSRRHAMIVVAGNIVTVHDLGSKNGTFVDRVRITTAVQLHELAEIRLGRLSMAVRRLREASATRTVSALLQRTR
jgi:DNA-binding winged helix-turn-helix (wHTH) protein